MAIFTISILPIHEHGRSFYLLRSSLIFFFRDLKFLPYRSFTCLVRVIPRYFILFVTIVKGVISLISLNCLSGLGVLWWNFWNHLSILSYHLQIVIFWLLPFFLAPQGTVSKIDHIIDHKTGLNRYKIIEIIPCILWDHYGLRLVFNNNKKD